MYNHHVPFPDQTKIIERAAFDEPMIEFGFWFGDDQFEGPMFLYYLILLLIVSLVATRNFLLVVIMMNKWRSFSLN
ncbi:hypothetical protein [Macrococcus armenti]|uniref:hypothetical protein n=1 Tax=Macrococcus armenti TaxID=2875764 RepID=UPI003B9747B2